MLTLVVLLATCREEMVGVDTFWTLQTHPFGAAGIVSVPL